MNLPPYRSGNRLVLGTTRCGKSTAEVIDITSAAADGSISIVVIDPHVWSLAWNAFIHLLDLGMRRRILFDRLSNFDRVLGYRFLEPSRAFSPIRRDAENEQTIREFIDVLLRRRDMQSLASNPLTEEMVYSACQLIVYQSCDVPASDIQFAFDIQSKRFQELTAGCTDLGVRQKFQDIASGAIKPGQYASARRLISSVCGSPAFTTRCHSTGGIQSHLANRGILLFEGTADGVSQDTASTTMGAIILQVIHYVRTRKKSTPRVLLVIDEATNANLIGAAGHEVRALAELQKKGLDVHILAQSPNFPNSFVEDGVLTNCVEHHWFYAANDAVAQKAARDLGDPEYRNLVRGLRRGERYIKRLNSVTLDKVTPLPDPWAWPGLAERKALKALKQILERDEYWSPSLCRETNHKTSYSSALPQTKKTPIGSNQSSQSLTGTSASQDISSHISPIDKLRIARQQSSDSSEP